MNVILLAVQIIINHIVILFGRTIQKLKENYKFTDYKKGFEDFELVYDDNKKELLLFGGVDDRTNLCIDKIRKYSLITKTWTICDLTLPPGGRRSVGIVITMDNRYVFGLGGQVGFRGTDSIFILDLKSMMFLPCNIKLPSRFDTYRVNCDAIIMHDANNNAKLVHGFLKIEMTKNKIQIPIVIIN